MTSIILTSAANVNRLIILIELAEEDFSNQSKGTTSSNQNVLEEEEQHFTNNHFLFPFENYSNETILSYHLNDISSVHIEIITPPPLGSR